MENGDKTQCLPHYRLLTEDQIRQIHEATLELLETTGVKVLLPEAVDLLAAAGCRADPDGLVRIPGRLVEQCIGTAPSSVTLYNRFGVESMRLEGRRLHFGMGTDLTRTYDLETGQLRPSRLADVIAAARIAETLPEIDFIASYALPYDSPANLMYVDSFQAQLVHASKPIFFTAAGKEDLAVIQDMAETVAGGAAALAAKPFHIHYAEPLSPLTHTRGALRKLFFCADHAVPVVYAPGMMAGATAPVTLAGAITMGNAEALSGIVLHQLRAQGAPIISGFGMSTIDMRSSACIYACPEYRLALSACADLYHHYGVPMWGTAGVADSHCLDQQAGMEWTASILTAVLDGANLVHDVGYLGQGLVGHPAALILCAEIISYARHFAGGFQLDRDHLALDVIGETGPQGSFLTSPHTLKHFRTEHWQPHLANRSMLDAWLTRGQTSWGDQAIRQARKILQDESEPVLNESIVTNLATLRDRALTELETIRFES